MMSKLFPEWGINFPISKKLVYDGICCLKAIAKGFICLGVSKL
jgi:hypothetical protein